MPRKITKSQLAMAEVLTYKLAEVGDAMVNLWFSIDSKHPTEAQIAVLIEMLGTIQRTVRNIVLQNGGEPK